MATTEEKLRQKAIDDIKHKNTLKWINLVTNPLTYISVIAFFVLAWYFDWNWKNALSLTATYFLEFFLIKYFDSKSQ